MALMIPLNKQATHKDHRGSCLNLEYGTHRGTINRGDEDRGNHSTVELWHCEDCNRDYLVDNYREGV